MQFDAASHRMWQEMTAQKHARDGCDKGDNRDQNEQPRLHRGPASNVEGASGLDGPKGESVTEASTGDVTPLLATPSSTAPKAATAPILNWEPAETCVLAAMRLNTRSEEHTSELQSLMRISYAVFCLKKKQ